jgi:hypothetical protein
VTLDIARIVSVEVDEVGVEGQRRVSEQQSARRGEGMGKDGLSRRCGALAWCRAVTRGSSKRLTYFEIFDGEKATRSDGLLLDRSLFLQED